MSVAGVLVRIVRYPVKGLSGVELPACRVEARGLAGDRRWMLVDAEGRFISRRTHPHLARLRLSEAGEALVVQAPGAEPLTILPPEPSAERMPVRIWDDVLPAAVAPALVSAWFARQVGAPCTLVYMPDDLRRPTDPAYAPGGIVSFADAYPVLVTTQASLADLNGRLAHPVEMDRFRPNLVVSGGAPYAEDAWGRFQLGEATLAAVKPCKRCVVTTLDPSTGRSLGPEPLRTLARYRASGGKVLFGQNVAVLGGGLVRLGDAVIVT